MWPLYKAEIPGSILGLPTTEIFGHFYGFSPTSPTYSMTRKGHFLTAKWQQNGSEPEACYTDGTEVLGLGSAARISLGLKRPVMIRRSACSRRSRRRSA